ncbi:hypothetical protein [Abyssalbus ytuae]|uniref:Uncharacterized protein n=1 Tax=Abyssalbus ytuae TaxID=2926907 RepID=A0A9E6ZPW3_9FLAO|nr:hypothetical protein [Abyssalbus ytuae]UOB16593.1 hypothetical protein MQE35_12710 [Abyssalbus ytuae]
MKDNRSLHDIIESLPNEFIEKIKSETDISVLTKMKKRLRNKDKIAVVEARIQNLNHLVA